MNKIKRLDQDTIAKISAGEVIIRPSNVVKELIENSIDASSNFIEVEIRKGGKELIRVTDNGHGISKDDLPLTIERFATSKLGKIDDLNRLSTLGFRGEALSSIAAVSELTIISSENGSSYKLEVKNQKNLQLTETASSTGTTVIVQNLFYNIPVRRKFLKTDQTETLSIIEVFTRYVLSFPHIHFRLIINGKVTQQYFAQKEYLTRAISVLGHSNTNSILQHSSSLNGINTIFIGSNSCFSRSYQKDIYTFVNNRFVNDRMLKRAIVDAYSKILPPDRYPTAILFLTISPEEVDVNVHPQKTEIRFINPPIVYNTVLNQITEFISKLKLKTKNDESEGISLVYKVRQEVSEIKEITTPSKYYNKPEYADKRYQQDPLKSDRIFNEDGYFSSLEILGQFQNRFILLKSPNSIVIIDQHAAQERILYNKIMIESQNRSPVTQRLLIPMNIELSHLEIVKLRSFLDDFIKIGFDIEIFSDNNAIIKGIPSAIAERFSEETFLNILNEVDEELHKLDEESILKELASRTACYASVRGRHGLNEIEIRRLLVDMDRTDFAIACPHGRPVFFEINQEEIEKRFLRK